MATTQKQKNAVYFVEEVLKKTRYIGDINDFEEVSSFLGRYLDIAKERFEDQQALYYEALGSCNDDDFYD